MFEQINYGDSKNFGLRYSRSLALDGLSLLNNGKHADPGFCMVNLPGERRTPGIAPRHGGGGAAVHFDHVVRQHVIVRLVAHNRHGVRPIIR